MIRSILRLGNVRVSLSPSGIPSDCEPKGRVLLLLALHPIQLTVCRTQQRFHRFATLRINRYADAYGKHCLQGLGSASVVNTCRSHSCLRTRRFGQDDAKLLASVTRGRNNSPAVDPERVGEAAPYLTASPMT